MDSPVHALPFCCSECGKPGTIKRVGVNSEGRLVLVGRCDEHGPLCLTYHIDHIMHVCYMIDKKEGTPWVDLPTSGIH